MIPAPPTAKLVSDRAGGWQALAIIVLGALVMFVLHRATVGETVSIWIRTDSYKFAWAVLPTFAYLLWHRRKSWAEAPLGPSFAAIPLALLCALLWAAGELLNIIEVKQFALIAALVPLCLAVLGPVLLRRSALGNQTN